MLCLECVGGPPLTLVEGEGMLRMRDYTAEMRDALAQAAEHAGVELVRGAETVAATDALVALRAGYRSSRSRRSRTQVPLQLPLAQRHAGEPRLEDDRARVRGGRPVRARQRRPAPPEAHGRAAAGSRGHGLVDALFAPGSEAAPLRPSRDGCVYRCRLR